MAYSGFWSHLFGAIDVNDTLFQLQSIFSSTFIRFIASKIIVLSLLYYEPLIERKSYLGLWL